MHRRPWVASLTCTFGILACSFSAGPTSTPVPSATFIPQTATPVAAQTYVLPSLTPSPTSTVAFVSPKEQRLNCRFGPGTAYAVMGALDVDQSTQIAGKNDAETWWYIHDPGNPGGFCWVLAELTDTTGNLTGLPVQPPPTVSVSKIEMSVSPPHRSVTCNAFPQTFYITAEITVNGPTIVLWRWEVSTGEVSADNPLTFTESGTQLIEYYYLTTSANDYAVRMHVVSPNDTFEQVLFRIDCTQ
jgi:SH3-like domain-containing protein